MPPRSDTFAACQRLLVLTYAVGEAFGRDDILEVGALLESREQLISEIGTRPLDEECRECLERVTDVEGRIFSQLQAECDTILDMMKRARQESLGVREYAKSARTLRPTG